MRRKMPGEKIKRLRIDKMNQFDDLGRKCARWGKDYSGKLAEADPDVPSGLHDRAADNWRPLLAIADRAGGEWPRLAREAALALSGDVVEDDSASVMLLEDVRKIIGNDDRIPSGSLVQRLVEMEERPWPEWRNGKPITVRQVARILKPFGIQPKLCRDGVKRYRGYLIQDFEDAFARYLPTPSVTSVTSLNNKELEVNLSVTKSKPVTDRKSNNSFNNNNVTDVTDKKPMTGGDSVKNNEIVHWMEI